MLSLIAPWLRHQVMTLFKAQWHRCPVVLLLVRRRTRPIKTRTGRPSRGVAAVPRGELSPRTDCHAAANPHGIPLMGMKGDDRVGELGRIIASKAERRKIFLTRSSTSCASTINNVTLIDTTSCHLSIYFEGRDHSTRISHIIAAFSSE